MKTSKSEIFSGTFSILAASPDLTSMGVAVASGSTFVGNRVPHAKPGIGVIATQAYTKISYGVEGLKLLTKGLTPQEALNKLLKNDFEKDSRQVAIMNFNGMKAVFTGANVPKHHSEIVGKDYIVMGNLLSEKKVADNMAKLFENTSGDLALRMAEALKAGRESGGDKRGEKSAALIVVDIEKVKVEVKIDAHNSPIEELFRRLISQS